MVRYAPLPTYAPAASRPFVGLARLPSHKPSSGRRFHPYPRVRRVVLKEQQCEGGKAGDDDKPPVHIELGEKPVGPRPVAIKFVETNASNVTTAEIIARLINPAGRTTVEIPMEKALAVIVFLGLHVRGPRTDALTALPMSTTNATTPNPGQGAV